MTRTHALPQAPAAALLAAALAATACAGALPGAGAAAPLERVVVTGLDATGSVVRAGGRVLEPLPLVGGAVALLPRGARLPASVSVAADRPLGLQSARAAAAPGPASTVRATLGLGAPAGEGRGVTVAVVDTGVADVAGLAGRVLHRPVAGVTPGDGLGHGTFIAGLLAGDGAGAGPAYAGVAPAATVLDVQVASADGATSLVDVLRGLQVVQDSGADVVNLSLSSESPLPTGVDPLAVALDRLWADGVTVVVPSGNDAGSVSSPGDDPLLLTVGGLDEGRTAERGDDAVASWSGRSASKPDLVAPGASLVSLLAPGSAAEAGQHTPGLPAGYGAGSGTSFATAVTSGAAAALLAQRPSLTPGQVKELLTGSAYRGKALKQGAGAGGLDLAAALAARTPKDKGRDAAAQLPTGDLAAWTAFVAAVLDGDADTAASSWSRLSPQARQWVGRQWASAGDADRAWAARQWAARQWAGADEQEWTARQWAARQWAARQWAAGDWSARQWAARQWAARQWAAEDWSARQWSARQWSARQWSAVGWR